MPPVPSTKSTRISRRSASPTAKPSSSKKSAAPTIPSIAVSSLANMTLNRSKGPYLYEEEYRKEHIMNLLEGEQSTLAQPDLMDQQPELRWHMRPFLIDFMVEIHTQIRLRPEVLYLAVNIVDRYVSRRVVYKKHYQLVGCAALWIAAKFEDSKEQVPLVRELYDMCCGAYEQTAFIQMEGHILTTIGWNANHPTAENWLRLFVSSPDSTSGETPLVQSTARYLMEITLFHKEFVGVRPSVIAWSAVVLARHIHNQAPSPLAPAYVSPAVVRRVVEILDHVFATGADQLSEIVTRKYSINHYYRCAAHVHEFYASGRRYVDPSEPPLPALAPSTPTWAGRHRLALTSSPGASSCASSDAEEEPITPNTPIADTSAAAASRLAHISAKENVAMDSSAVAVKSHGMGHLVQHQQPVLNASTTNSSLAIPPSRRALRRLSN